MYNTRMTHGFILALCILLSAGCGNKASDEIEFGAVSNAIYQNKYFGLNLPLPPDWSVQDAAARKRIADTGSKMIAGDDKGVTAILKASEQQTVNLLAVFKHPAGTAVPFNPSVLSVAERTRDFPGIKQGRDYLFHSKKLMEAGQMKVEFPKEMSMETLGGIDFDVMHVSLSIGKLNVRQKYYATIMKGYALAFIISFTTADEEAVLQKILQGMSFKA